MSEFNPHSLEPFWGTWYIDSLIGEGSFGSVYKIYREEFGNKYYSALKIISIPKSTAEEKQVFYEGMDENSATQYFHDIVEVIYKEIAIMSELKGKSNIVSYEDHKIVQKEKGVGFHILIRMELLESLNDYLQHTSITNEAVVNLGKDLCKALILCQKRNIIHRDIKPANIFVSFDGDFKLGDFGIARQLEGAQDGLSIKGTYGYMAPEVYLGNMYDERVDIYSLGMVLYYYLNNKKGPFTITTTTVQKFSERQEGLKKRFSGEKLPRPTLASNQLADVVLKACEFDPKNRFLSAEEFLGALESLSKLDLQTVINESGMVQNCVDGANENQNYAAQDSTIAVDDNIYSNSNQMVAREIEEATTSMQYPQDFSGVTKVQQEYVEQTQLLSGKGEAETKPNDQRTVYMDSSDEATVYMNSSEESTVYMNRPEEFASEEKSNINLKKKGKKKHFIVIAFIVIVLIAGGGTAYMAVNSNKESKGTEQLAENSVDSNLVANNKTEEASSLTDLLNMEGEANSEEVVEAAAYEVELDKMELRNCQSIKNIELLTSLSISFNDLNSVSELKDSIWLNYLNVEDNKIVEISALRDMVRLTCFNAVDNQIEDLSPLSNLTALEILLLSNNKIISIDDLANLISLSKLRIDGNEKLKNISVLSNMEHLQILTLASTGITDISPLYGLKNLILLDLTDTDIPEEQIKKLSLEVPGCEIIQ